MLKFRSKTYIIVEKDLKLICLNLILSKNLTYYKLYEKNEKIYFEISLFKKKRFTEIFDNANIKYEIKETEGLLNLIKTFRLRVGVLIGVIFLIFTLYLSSNVVWKINISGNNQLNDEKIIEILENCGFYVGKFIPNIKYDELHNNVLLANNDISWISVNISGNVANVEIKETLKEDINDKNTYCNIVSRYDGYISSINVINGERVVSSGEVVKKGDLLISGIVDSKAEGVRYLHAEGEIKAYVNKEILIKIPHKTEIKAYTGKVVKEKRLKLFSKYINFSLKSNKYDEFYDKINKIESINIFGIDNLPIMLETTKLYQYQYQEINRSKQEIIDLAFKELNYEMNEALKDAELISKSIKSYYDGESYYIECDLYCLEDIAEEVEIFIDK